jgi:hypothetical protein
LDTLIESKAFAAIALLAQECGVELPVDMTVDADCTGGSSSSNSAMQCVKALSNAVQPKNVTSPSVGSGQSSQQKPKPKMVKKTMQIRGGSPASIRRNGGDSGVKSSGAKTWQKVKFWGHPQSLGGKGTQTDGGKKGPAKGKGKGKGEGKGKGHLQTKGAKSGGKGKRTW